MKNRNKIVVSTWDFTEVSEHALAHAQLYAKRTAGKIHCLHICGKNDDQDDLKKQIEARVKELDLIRSVEVVVKKGNIYSSINEYTEEVKAEMVIMGTHGRIGVQKIFGLKALRVIAGSQVPFLVIQKEPFRKFEELVLPFDAAMEGREKLRWLTYFAEKYKLTVRIIKKYSSVEDIRKKINTNVAFARKILDENNIPYKIDLETNKKDFPNEVVDFADKIEAGLIMVMTTKNPGITDYMFAAEEQKIIANKSKLPVICINPRDDLKRPTFFN